MIEIIIDIDNSSVQYQSGQMYQLTDDEAALVDLIELTVQVGSISWTISQTDEIILEVEVYGVR